MALKVIGKDFFVYDFFCDTIAPGDANKPITVTVQNDSQFLWQKTAFFCDIGGAVQTQSSRVLPLVSMQVFDTSSGRQQFNVPVPVPAIAGDGQFPFILPEPRLLVPKSTITIELSNYSAATTYVNLHILMIGTKIFMGEA